MSLVETRLQNLRAKARLDKNMVRPDQFGAVDYFIREANSGRSLIGDDQKQAIFGSMGRSVEVPVLNYNGDVTVSTSRSCTIPDAENTSALYAVTFATYQVGMTMVPALYLNNEIGYQRDFEKKALDITRALKNKLDQGAVAALTAAKTQVFTDPLVYTPASNVIPATWNQRTDILGDVDVLMAANGYNGHISVVGNYGVQALISKLAQLGNQQAIDKISEYAGKDFFTSVNIANASGKYATFFAAEDGNVDLLTRVDRQAYIGGEAQGHEWTVATLPGLDIPLGVHFYTEVGDKSTIAGDASADMTCVIAEKWGFSVDVAFVTAYNSAPTTKANPFISCDIATGEGTGLPVSVTTA